MSISKLTIENFKSVEKLSIAPTRVNVFIGAPNAGKTNILEALSLVSIGFPSHYKDSVRFEETADLFTDLEVSKKIKVETDLLSATINLAKLPSSLFELSFFQNATDNAPFSVYNMNYNGELSNVNHNKTIAIPTTRILRYIFKPAKGSSPSSFQPFLNPPFGENIPNLLKTNTALRKSVADVFKDFGLKQFLAKNENTIMIVREEDDTLILFKYPIISNTVQRVVFMLSAIQSNTDCVLLFDEPEANIYPFYSQTIANHIANNKKNQFFMTSHSAYLISKLIDETPPEELSIFYTEMKDFRTVARKLSASEVERFASMGEDAMLNLTNIAE